MLYIYIDGDDIGLEIEKCFMENDEASLKQINEEMNSLAKKMSSYFIDIGFSVLFLGADGIICKGESINIKKLSSFIRKISNRFTFSIGAGNNLRDAFLALRYAKSIGKNVNVLLIDNVFEVGRLSS
jgi:hypothetical protein